MTAMHFNVGHATDIGRKRTQNQDNLAIVPELGLFVVADGMGGHQGGEIASAIAVQTVPEIVRKLITTTPNWDPRQVIAQALGAANQAIHKRSLDEAPLKGMGTTTTALIFKGDLLTIGHIGDSRCYYLREKAIWQATRDHSLVQEKLRAGIITRADVKTDRMKNVITRSVGFEPKVEPDIYQMKVRPKDAFLICSDGLSGQVEDSKMLELVSKHLFNGKNPQKAVQELIVAANEHGGDDNITTVLIEVTAGA